MVELRGDRAEGTPERKLWSAVLWRALADVTSHNTKESDLNSAIIFFSSTWLVEVCDYAGACPVEVINYVKKTLNDRGVHDSRLG